MPIKIGDNYLSQVGEQPFDVYMVIIDNNFSTPELGHTYGRGEFILSGRGAWAFSGPSNTFFMNIDAHLEFPFSFNFWQIPGNYEMVVTTRLWQIVSEGNRFLVEFSHSTMVSVLPPPSTAGSSSIGLGNTSDSGNINDNITNINSPTVFGLAAADSEVTIHDGNQQVAMVHADKNGYWTALLHNLSDGAHGLTTSVLHLDGFTSAKSDPFVLTIDTVCLAPSQLALANGYDTGPFGDGTTGKANPIITGLAEAYALITLFEGETEIGAAAVNDNGIWSVQSKLLPEGAHAITARAIDSAGNASSLSNTLNIIVDITAPAMLGAPDLKAGSDSGLSAMDNITKASTPTFMGKAEAGATIKLFDGAQEVGSTKAGITGAWSVNSSIMTEGVHAMTIQVTDIAGNSSVMSTALSVTIDTTAPSVPTVPNLTPGSDTGKSSTDNITSATTPTFMGTAEGNATVNLYEGVKSLGTTKTSAGGAWSIKSSALSDGKHVIQARTTDNAGNIGKFSMGLPVTIDTVPPAIGPLVTAVTAKSISGTAEANTIVSLLDNGVPISGTVSANARGTWVKSIALNPGNHTIAGKAADLAGNTRDITPSGFAIIGTIGDDVLTGVLGPRLMAGGTGNDTYRVDDSADVISESAAEGVSDIIRASVNYTIGGESRIEFLTSDAGEAGLALGGNRFINTITGGIGNDTLIGGGGADMLSGGGGANVFVLEALSDSTVAASGRDRIADFSELAGDKIDLHLLDADTTIAGDQAFTFIGTAVFSAKAGQVIQRTFGADTLIQGDVNGDGAADLSILLTGSHTLGVGTLVL